MLGTRQHDPATVMAINVLDHGGGTYVPHVWRHIDRDHGYMSSLESHEVRRKLPDRRLDALKAIRNAAEDYASARNRLWRAHDLYVGLWVNGSTLYLDVSRWHAERQAAEAAGRAHHQEAIYGIAEDAVIYL